MKGRLPDDGTGPIQRFAIELELHLQKSHAAGAGLVGRADRTSDDLDDPAVTQRLDRPSEASKGVAPDVPTSLSIYRLAETERLISGWSLPSSQP